MRWVTIIIGLLVAASLLHAEPPKLAGYKLVFDDEFDGDKVDTAKWNLRDPWELERNQELQAYVPDAFEVKGGILHIRAEQRPRKYAGKDRPYTSGMMTTLEKFAQKFGRFEVRCRVPKGKGLWPAAWLLPQPLAWPPEIDILEILCHEPGKIYMTHHWMDADDKGKPKRGSDGGEWKGPDFSEDFHVFAVDWTPESIAWSVDGVERFRSIKHIPQKLPMYVLLNLAVGGDWPGKPDERTVFPATFDVDYVRVWAKE